MTVNPAKLTPAAARFKHGQKIRHRAEDVDGRPTHTQVFGKPKMMRVKNDDGTVMRPGSDGRSNVAKALLPPKVPKVNPIEGALRGARGQTFKGEREGMTESMRLGGWAMKPKHTVRFTDGDAKGGTFTLGGGLTDAGKVAAGAGGTATAAGVGYAAKKKHDKHYKRRDSGTRKVTVNVRKADTMSTSAFGVEHSGISKAAVPGAVTQAVKATQKAAAPGTAKVKQVGAKAKTTFNGMSTNAKIGTAAGAAGVTGVGAGYAAGRPRQQGVAKSAFGVEHEVGKGLGTMATGAMKSSQRWAQGGTGAAKMGSSGVSVKTRAGGAVLKPKSVISTPGVGKAPGTTETIGGGLTRGAKIAGGVGVGGVAVGGGAHLATRPKQQFGKGMGGLISASRKLRGVPTSGGNFGGATKVPYKNMAKHPSIPTSKNPLKRQKIATQQNQKASSALAGWA